LLAYNQLQTDPWWRLYMKMKPLLATSRAMEQDKAKKEAIAAVEARLAAEVYLDNAFLTVEKTHAKA
jgi:myosin heavy subunit